MSARDHALIISDSARCVSSRCGKFRPIQYIKFPFGRALGLRGKNGIGATIRLYGFITVVLTIKS